MSADQRMSSRASVIAGLIFLGVAWAPGIATACLPAMSKPGETPEAARARWAAEADAYERNRQHDLWTKADRVFTARVSRGFELPPPPRRSYDPRRDGPPKPPEPVEVPVFDPSYWEVTWVIAPIAGLKGVAPTKSFEIVQSTSMTSCGHINRFNDGAGSFNQDDLDEGQIVVVFLKGPYPTQKGLLGTLTPDKVVDPALKAALAAAGAGP